VPSCAGFACTDVFVSSSFHFAPDSATSKSATRPSMLPVGSGPDSACPPFSRKTRKCPSTWLFAICTRPR
jgi:hypothetical protein